MEDLDQIRIRFEAESNDMLEDLRGQFRLLQQETAATLRQQQVQFNLLQQAMSGIQSQLQSTSPRRHSLPHPKKLDSTGGGRGGIRRVGCGNQSQTRC